MGAEAAAKAKEEEERKRKQEEEEAAAAAAAAAAAKQADTLLIQKKKEADQSRLAAVRMGIAAVGVQANEAVRIGINTETNALSSITCLPPGCTGIRFAPESTAPDVADTLIISLASSGTISSLYYNNTPIDILYVDETP